MTLRPAQTQQASQRPRTPGVQRLGHSKIHPYEQTAEARSKPAGVVIVKPSSSLQLLESLSPLALEWRPLFITGIVRLFSQQERSLRPIHGWLLLLRGSLRCRCSELRSTAIAACWPASRTIRSKISIVLTKEPK